MQAFIPPAGVRRVSHEPALAEILRHPTSPRIDRVVKPSSCDATTYGKPTVKSESVGKCFTCMRVTGLEAKKREFVEQAVYRSRISEPLGKTRQSRFTLPPTDHAFGKPLTFDGSIRDILTGERYSENKFIHELYKKSHHAFYPGEQIDRKYQWPAEVKSDFQFGVREKRSEPAGSVLRWEETSGI